MKKIVIVDDDEQIAELLKVNLESSGHVVEKILTNIPELELYFREDPSPDVIILDLLMNSDFGTDILGELYEGWKNTKVYIFTGYSEYKEEYPFIDDIVDAVFIKPDFTPLISKIEK